MDAEAATLKLSMETEKQPMEITQTSGKAEAESPDKSVQAEAAKAQIHISVLARLIEEVRNEETISITAYNRMHNRHNRSR